MRYLTINFYHAKSPKTHVENLQNRRFGQSPVWIIAGLAGNYCTVDEFFGIFEVRGHLMGPSRPFLRSRGQIRDPAGQSCQIFGIYEGESVY